MDSLEHLFLVWKCKKCGAEWNGPDTCEYCPVCGKKINPAPANAHKKRGNGQGSAYKMPGGGWRAAVTVGLDEQGRPERITKSGFKTKTEALAYISKLREDGLKKQNNAPLHAVYRAWLETHKRSQSTLNCYSAAYKHLAPLHNRPFRNISVDDWQRCIDECPLGRRTKENIRALVSLLYKYAIPRNLVDPELMTFKGEFLKIYEASSAESQKHGFTQTELGRLWEHTGDDMVATILVMCYTGFRLGEFLSVSYEDGCLRGGSKTDAGRDRIVPLTPILDDLYRSCRKHTSQKAFRADFYDALDRVGIENKDHRLTPHSTRHTFATLLKSAKGSDKDKLALIGHHSEEMLRYYQDVDIESLRKIMEQL